MTKRSRKQKHAKRVHARVTKPAPARDTEPGEPGSKPGTDSPRFRRRPPSGPLLIAVFAWVFLAFTCDPTDAIDGIGDGPGLTIDEGFNTAQGVFLVRAVEAFGLGVLDPSSLREIFEHPNYLPDHPPLGRFLLGIAHESVLSVASPVDGEMVFVVAAARIGSVTLFALTLLMVGWASDRWFGPLAGWTASLSLLLMPRVTGHAQIASLETAMNLSYLAVILSVAMWSSRPERVTRCAILSGILLGLAFLTKIQAILLPVPIALWAFWEFRTRAIVPLVVMAFVAGLVLLIGWPHLWFAPLERLTIYFGRTTERAVLHTYYWGSVWDDRDVPFHYPWVMLLVTLPVGSLVPLACGLLPSKGEAIDGATDPVWRTPIGRLLIACVLFPPLLFSLPGVAVYDGVRLFLVSFPPLAMLLGAGCVRLMTWGRHRFGLRPAAGLLGGLFAVQAVPLLLAFPLGLTQYSLAIGGPAGAERLGMEVDYWSVGVTPELLRGVAEVVPEGAEVELVPVLHPFQVRDLLMQSPPLRSRGVGLIPFDATQPLDRNSRQERYLLIDHRRADLTGPLREVLHTEQPLRKVSRGGVVIAGLYRLEGIPRSEREASLIERN